MILGEVTRNRSLHEGAKLNTKLACFQLDPKSMQTS